MRSFEIAKDLDYRAVFVVGDPKHYFRFGFKASALFGIKHTPPIPDQFVLVYELLPLALNGINGAVTFT
jgi:putative acetyltransferase